MDYKEIIDLINKEIKWCEENRNSRIVSLDYSDGFVEGLRQAIRLINAIHKVEMYGEVMFDSRKKS